MPITNVGHGSAGDRDATPACPAKDLNEFIAYARANPKRVNYGSAGIGTQTHLAAGELRATAAGIDLTHVPTRGRVAPLTDLLGGQIQLATPNLAARARLHQERQAPGARRHAAASAMRSCPTCPSAAGIAAGLRERRLVLKLMVAAAGSARRTVIDKVQQDSAKILLAAEFRGAARAAAGHAAGTGETRRPSSRRQIRSQEALLGQGHQRERGLTAD